MTAERVRDGERGDEHRRHGNQHRRRHRFMPLVLGMRGWRVQPAHFAERHGLIVIIAIGESLIAIGLGEAVSGLSTGVIVAAVLGFAVARLRSGWRTSTSSRSARISC